MIATRGYALAVAGRRADALKVVDELEALSKETYVSPYFFAVIYSGLGQKEEAFGYLEQAVAERHPYLILTNVEPVFDNLRPDPRFASIIDKIGIPR
jgi:tetratricopeptide (TPR) repeat protein